MVQAYIIDRYVSCIPITNVAHLTLVKISQQLNNMDCLAVFPTVIRGKYVMSGAGFKTKRIFSGIFLTFSIIRVMHAYNLFTVQCVIYCT